MRRKVLFTVREEKDLIQQKKDQHRNHAMKMVNSMTFILKIAQSQVSTSALLIYKVKRNF